MLLKPSFVSPIKTEFSVTAHLYARVSLRDPYTAAHADKYSGTA